MVPVEAGWFEMGSDTGRRSYRPAHQVYLDAFHIDKFEVTNLRYETYVLESGDRPAAWGDSNPRLDPHRPVTGILWEEAQAFCQWYGKRLPTEAEWEKAARGSDGRLYPWGDEWERGRANAGKDGHRGPVSVVAYPRGSSPFGAVNMVGNVQEWVADYYDPDYYARSPTHNPTGPEKTLDHVLRGGYWASPTERANAVHRNSSHSARPNERVGFRCAMDWE